jgi:membrane protease YdiL (CAAX protease family)
MDERLTPPWRALDAIPVAIGAILATSLIGSLLALALPDDTALVLVGFAFEASLAGITLAWVHYRHRGAIPALHLGSSRPRADIGFGLASGGALYVGVVFVAPALFVLISLVTGEPVSTPEQQVLPSDPGNLELVLGGIFAIVAAPIGEELFFRGLLFGGLRRRYGFWASALISGAVFGIFHPPPLLMPLLFTVGVGLAWVYERRGSLIPSMVAHAVFNIVGFTLLAQGT